MIKKIPKFKTFKELYNYLNDHGLKLELMMALESDVAEQYYAGVFPHNKNKLRKIVKQELLEFFNENRKLKIKNIKDLNFYRLGYILINLIKYNLLNGKHY